MYVHRRNDFFFLDKPTFSLVSQLTANWVSLSPDASAAYRSLVKLGICETRDPSLAEEPYSGTAFIGHFEDIPKVVRPLVINCFTTAHCPLLCRYCHADDLMKPFRKTETESDLDRVIQTVNAIEATVAVITGGDPLTRVHRAVRLIEGIAQTKALTLDTSGVPSNRRDLDLILPSLRDHDVHVRVSLDEFETKMRECARSTECTSQMGDRRTATRLRRSSCSSPKVLA